MADLHIEILKIVNESRNPLTTAQIAYKTKTDPTAVSHMLHLLSSKGHVHRVASKVRWVGKDGIEQRRYSETTGTEAEEGHQ